MKIFIMPMPIIYYKMVFYVQKQISDFSMMEMEMVVRFPGKFDIWFVGVDMIAVAMEDYTVYVYHAP